MDFIGIYFRKIEILIFGGQYLKISKIRDSHFVEPSILRLFLFWITFHLKPVCSRSLQTFATF